MELEDDKYQIKPMNCPIHIAVYRSALRSFATYRFALQNSECVYRYERSGVMHGLMRVADSQFDDAHLFCTLDQLENEIKGAWILHFHCGALLDLKIFKSFWQLGLKKQ